jgi:TRAP-type C4-dicarboxylate transport system permease small subunit
MNFNQELRKIKTANLLAIIVVVFIMVFTICLFFLEVPSSNKELMNNMIFVIVAMNGAISGYLFGTRKPDSEDIKKQ